MLLNITAPDAMRQELRQALEQRALYNDRWAGRLKSHDRPGAARHTKMATALRELAAGLGGDQPSPRVCRAGLREGMG